MRKVLDEKFFARPVLRVAPLLLGKILVRRFSNKERAYQIVEVEAYDGAKDLACHGSQGFKPRNRVMFEPGGVWYIYLIHGVHFMLNIISGKKGYPAGILIRSLKGITGPGRLTRALKINKKLNGQKANRKSGLWLEDRGVKIKLNQIRKTPRIGVVYAGPIWSKKPYRFLLYSNLPGSRSQKV